MGRRPSNLPAFAGRALVLVAGAAIALGCVARAQGFEAWNGAFRADVSDRTGTVASIAVLERPGPGSELAGGAIRLRNVDRRTVEVAWLGGACATNARFSLAPEPNDAIGLR